VSQSIGHQAGVQHVRFQVMAFLRWMQDVTGRKQKRAGVRAVDGGNV
jgi:hypothetical protein